jgi:hypothetical protein
MNRIIITLITLCVLSQTVLYGAPALVYQIQDFANRGASPRTSSIVLRLNALEAFSDGRTFELGAAVNNARLTPSDVGITLSSRAFAEANPEFLPGLEVALDFSVPPYPASSIGVRYVFSSEIATRTESGSLISVGPAALNVNVDEFFEIGEGSIEPWMEIVDITLTLDRFDLTPIDEDTTRLNAAWTWSFYAVPEPGTVAMVGAGIVLVALYAYRRRSAFGS